MKSITHIPVLLLIGILITGTGNSTLSAQVKHESVIYLEKMAKQSDKINNAMWEYIKTSAHKKNLALVEQKRRNVISSVKNAINIINGIVPYEDDKIFKKAVLKYLNIVYSLLREDYSKIVNMEEIAEQSYDLMEAYLLAREKAKDKLRLASEELVEKQKEYAKKHDITLIDKPNEISKKLEISSKVMDYYNAIYLIFFKSYKQELYLMDALKHEDVSKIEQNRKTLEKYSAAGIKKLVKIRSYDGDSSLLKCGNRMLSFYNEEASGKIPVLTDFLMKKERFEKIRKAMELKKSHERTKEDIDLYNKKVAEMNAGANSYNKTNSELNTRRNRLINEWNRAQTIFFDKHIPH